MSGQIHYVPNQALDSPFTPNKSSFPLVLPISINTTITQLGAPKRDLGVILNFSFGISGPLLSNSTATTRVEVTILSDSDELYSHW